MNIDKLTEAIQIIVREEIKRILPKIVKKTTHLEVKRILAESVKHRNTNKQSSNDTTFMEEDSILNTENLTNTKSLSKNPTFNKILNETKPFDSRHRSEDDGGFRTMNFDTNDVHTLGAGNIADRLGYGEYNKPQPTGLGVSTGNDVLDKVFNRDYSALVKAMDKKK